MIHNFVAGIFVYYLHQYVHTLSIVTFALRMAIRKLARGFLQQDRVRRLGTVDVVYVCMLASPA